MTFTTQYEAVIFETFHSCFLEGDKRAERDRDRPSIFEAFIVRRSLSHGRGSGNAGRPEYVTTW